MLSGSNNNCNINVSSALLLSSNQNFVPMVFQQGLFGMPQYLPFEWSASNIAIINYTMDNPNAIKGSPAVTDATVVPNVKASFSMKSTMVGRCEANILYHNRPNTNIDSNFGTMHVDLVSNGFLEWSSYMAKAVDRALINSYSDPLYAGKGLTGMLDFATEINSPTLDPANYGQCYAFFAEQIDELTSTLNVSASSIRVIIGNDVVQAMQMTPILGTTTTVWQSLLISILSDVQLKVVPKFYHANQCSFVALDFISPVTIANTEFATLGNEKETVGNHQFCVFMEYILPSIIVSNDKACRHQSEMIASTKMLSTPTTPQTVFTMAGNGKKNVNKPPSDLNSPVSTKDVDL